MFLCKLTVFFTSAAVHILHLYHNRMQDGKIQHRFGILQNVLKSEFTKSSLVLTMNVILYLDIEITLIQKITHFNFSIYQITDLV